MTNTFPELGYSYDSLEPFIDAKTMEIHYSKHHKAYFDKFIAAVKGTKIEKEPISKILSNLNLIPQEIKTAVVNNGGGYYNHSLFWQILKKDSKFNSKSEIGKAITKKYGSYEKFKEEFSNAAITQFGSGWAWLVINEKKELEIIQTKNQDCPLSLNKKPILALDVWEHSYYLKYQNRRPEYVEAFFNIINWEKVNELFRM